MDVLTLTRSCGWLCWTGAKLRQIELGALGGRHETNQRRSKREWARREAQVWRAIVRYPMEISASVHYRARRLRIGASVLRVSFQTMRSRHRVSRGVHSSGLWHIQRLMQNLEPPCEAIP